MYPYSLIDVLRNQVQFIVYPNLIFFKPYFPGAVFSGRLGGSLFRSVARSFYSLKEKLMFKEKLFPSVPEVNK